MLHNIGNALSLVFKSLVNRRATAILTVASIAVSAGLLSIVDRVRTDTQTSFAKYDRRHRSDRRRAQRRSEPAPVFGFFVSATPRTTSHGTATRRSATDREVDWTIPFSLGDAHRGYRVLGTDLGYFSHYRYADRRSLAFDKGGPFTSATEAVIGAEVAERLGYDIGRQIVVSHGLADTSFLTHDEDPFTISGILARTGTPVDRTVHISLGGMDLIHTAGGADRKVPPVAGYEPEEITAFLIGLKSRTAIFALQRFVNEFEDEPMTAVIPGVALQQLWGLVRVAEYALLGVSAMVVLASVLGLLSTLLVSLNERRREMSVLRSVGARPGHIFALLLSEAAILAFLGALSGLLLVQLGILAIRQFALSEFGIQLSVQLRAFDLYVLTGILGIAVLVSIVPAWRAYRNSLADGLTVRL